MINILYKTIKSLHEKMLNALYLYFANIFIRYGSKQSTSELSLIATETVSITVLFL